MNDNSISSYQDILVAEFNYISQTATQAQEDRSRVYELFLISIGSLLIAVITSQFKETATIVVYRGLSLLFLFIAVFGVFTLLHLSRLRKAWYESILALNTIKDSIIVEAPQIAECFRWRTNTIPPIYKKWSVGFLLALEVSLIIGIVGGASVYFWGLSNGSNVPTICIITTSICLMFFNLLFFYYLPLKKDE